MSSTNDTRPYRSHLVPACRACRRRKVRCEVDRPSEPCRHCRARNLQCERARARASASTAKSPRNRDAAGGDAAATATDYAQPSSPLSRRSRRHSAAAAAAPPAQTTTTTTTTTGLDGPSETSPLFVTPTMAEDVDVLERYLGAASAAVGAFQPVRPYVRISNSSGQSIVYNTVPRQRRGLPGAHSAGVAQREIIEHVVAPHVDDVLRTFFDRLHPCFPVLDAAMFWDLWHADRKRLSSTLVCDMIAIALPFFARSDDAVPVRLCPDVPFVWNQAVLALRDDFLAPSVATVHAATLDMLGRPIFQVTGNIITFVHLCSLTQILGDVLPLVYALSRKPEHALRSIRRIESSMDDWEDSLPDYLRTPAYGSAAIPAVNGASGLWFYFLSVKLIVHRLAYKITADDADASPEEARKYRAVLLRNAALAIVEYTISLRISQLREFWLPYTAHLLVSATTILLRCAIDLSSPAESVTIIGKLAKLLDFLRDASRDAQWDLADFCLGQCAHPIETIAAALSASSASISVALSGPGSERRMTREMEPLGQEEQISWSEMLDPSKFLDDLFDPLWYNFDAASDLR